MPAPSNPAPRGTRAVVAAMMEALDAVSETHRKAAFKHAIATVREKLEEQARKAKEASWRAPALPGAKRKAAVAAARRVRSMQSMTDAV